MITLCIYIYAYSIYICIYIYNIYNIYIYIYIYNIYIYNIYITVRILHPQSKDSQDQEMFLAPFTVIIKPATMNTQKIINCIHRLSE